MQISPKTKDIITVIYVLVSLAAIGVITYLYISCKGKGEAFVTCQGLDRQIWTPWGKRSNMYRSGQLTESSELTRPDPPWDYNAPMTQFSTYAGVAPTPRCPP